MVCGAGMGQNESMKNGYALIDETTKTAFSWHPNFEDAQFRADFELRIYRRKLKIVKDVEAIWWPEWMLERLVG